ncbi:Tip elongation aberrant protein 1, partial [Termitomyces sp. J132]
WEFIKPLSEIPARRTGHVCIAHGHQINIFGGTDGKFHYNDTWRFDIHICQWSEIHCIGYIPEPREGHAAALVNDVIYIFGGRSGNGKNLQDDLCAFQISDMCHTGSHGLVNGGAASFV